MTGRHRRDEQATLAAAIERQLTLPELAIAQEAPSKSAALLSTLYYDLHDSKENS